MFLNNFPKFALAAFFLVSMGCASTTDSLSQQQALATSMEQCLAAQVLGNEQLSLQQTQLTEITNALGGIREEIASMEIRPAPVAAKKDIPACRPSTSTVAADNTHTKLLVGQREKVRLEGIQLDLPARIDTGAETASIDARNIELFERNGRRWVKFEILHPETNEPIAMERKLKRTVLITQATNAEPERRRVIKLAVTVGHITQSAEFTLSDRSHLDYQVLIGRNILQDVMIVDVSKENVAPPKETEAASQSDRGNS